MNVLFLTHRLPYAPNRGDRIRAYFLLQFLKQRADVTVMSLVHDEGEASHASDLRAGGFEVVCAGVPRWKNALRSAIALPSNRPTTHSMLDAPDLRVAIRNRLNRGHPDIVLAYCSGMAQYALESPLDQYPMILDMVDVDSAKWRQLSTVSKVPLSWVYRREARTLGIFERHAATVARATTVVTEQECQTLLALAPQARVEVVPNGVDVESFRNREAPQASSDVVFCGVMNYPPNEHAATLLARDVWPAVRSKIPHATLTIVGSQPTAAVSRLADATHGVIVTGSVADVRPFLWKAALAAAPIVTARGIQNKVLEAVAAGLPVVVTPNIAESLPPQLSQAVIACSGSAELSAAIIRLLSMTPGERRAMADSANVASIGWERQLSPFADLIGAVVSQPKSKPGASGP